MCRGTKSSLATKDEARADRGQRGEAVGAVTEALGSSSGQTAKPPTKEKADGRALSPQNGALQARNLESAPLGRVKPTCGGTPRSDQKSIAPFAVVFESRQSPLHWNKSQLQSVLTGSHSNSKAVGIAQPTALPCPLRAVFWDSIGRMSKLVSEAVRLPSHSSQAAVPWVQRDTQSRRSNDSVHAIMLKIGVAVPSKRHGLARFPQQEA